MPKYLGKGIPAAVDTRKGTFLFNLTKAFVVVATTESASLNVSCMVIELASLVAASIDIPSGRSSSFVFDLSQSDIDKPCSLNCLSKSP